MNNIIELPNKILVKIMRDNNGVFVAELPEYDLHTEADTVWDLISNVNDIVKLYFDIPQNSLGDIIYAPSIDRKEPEVRQLKSIDFLKYLLPTTGICLQ